MRKESRARSVASYGVLPLWLLSFGVHGAVTPQCSNPRLSYFGGPVLANVEVVPVFYNSSVNAAAVAKMPQFYADVVTSSYWSWLCEYDTPTQHIGPGTATVGYTMTGGITTGTTSDPALESLLVQEVSLGHLPAPTSNTLYMVHFPPSVSITGPNGIGMSCVDFCSYHSSFASGTNVFVYAAIMDTSTSGCASGCAGNASPLDNETQVASHELVEAVLDPYVGLDTDVAYAYPCGWADNNNACGEIGDVCDNAGAGDTITVSGRTWMVQEMWSDCQGQCTSSGPVPVANNQSLTTYQGSPLSITLSMANGSSFCHYQLFTVTTGPAHGVLSGSSSNLVYTPAAGFAGQDSFQFAANGSPGTVSISVVPLLITTAAFDATMTNFVVCWNSEPGVGYTVLTNNLPAALAIWTAAGTTNAAGTNTCFVLGGGPAASSSLFVAVRKNQF